MFFSKGIHEGFLFSTDNNHDGLNYITKNKTIAQECST